MAITATTAVVTNSAAEERLKLAVGLRRQGYYLEARKIALDLASARPEIASVWHTLGQIWTELGQFDLALTCNQEAMRLIKAHGNPERDTAQFQTISLGLATALMRYGRFWEAWPYWEAGRIGLGWSPWPGSQQLTGGLVKSGSGSLLVQAEGGYGDTFMFMRWLPLLKPQFGFSKIGLMLWKPLVNLCDWKSLGVDEVYEIDQSYATFDWTYATSIMSLPGLFRMRSWDDIPPVPPIPGVTDARGRRNAKIKEIKDVFRIGLCWRSEENSIPTKVRSLPVTVAEQLCAQLNNKSYLDAARPSVPVRPVQTYSLCPQRADLYTPDGEFAEPSGLVVESTKMTDWRATSDYIASMDLVITVDTAVAHLAGLLQVPTVLLLPCGSDWRWGIESPQGSVVDSGGGGGGGGGTRWKTPWYGSKLTCYRSYEPLSWDVEEIMREVSFRFLYG